MRKRPLAAAATCLLTLGLFPACVPDDRAGSDDRLTLTGSSTVAPLITAIAERFEAQHPGVRVDVQTGGSSRGLADLRRGLADIALVSRTLTEDDGDLEAHVVAVDGIALVVHRDNPVEALNRETVAGIFEGEIGDWAEVGGAPGAITVVDKADGRATLAIFLAHFGLERSAIRAQVVIGDNLHGLRTVAADPAAIAYVSIGAIEVEIARGQPLRMPALDGVAPGSDAVRQGTYTLFRPLSLVTGPEPPTLAAAFVAFARAPAQRDLVRRFHYVPP